MGGLVADGGRDVVWSEGVHSLTAAGAVAVDGHFLEGRINCSRMEIEGGMLVSVFIV